MTTALHHGDCLQVMAQMARDGVKVDSIVCDPPYHLTSIVKRFGGKNAAAAQHGTNGLYARASAGFMGKQWDGGDIAFRAETWALALDLLKPGGHILAFSGTRTYHRMAVAIEDAGFVIRDQFAWVYGSGFPKSHDISKAIDKGAGIARERIRGVRSGVVGDVYAHDAWSLANKDSVLSSEPITTDAAEWEGWGTAVKPAWEPICVGQKPVEGTIAGNVLKYGTGGLNIDGCRIEATDNTTKEWRGASDRSREQYRTGTSGRPVPTDAGRFPANLIHDGSDEVVALFPDSDGQQGDVRGTEPSSVTADIYGKFAGRVPAAARNDNGSSSRFFYTAKADADDRWGSKHPTVKPVDLIRYFARLITPPGGLILDPFAGSGTLGVAAIAEGFNSILIEREDEYVADIRERIAFYEGGDRHSMASKNRNATQPKNGESPLIDWLETRMEAAE